MGRLKRIHKISEEKKLELKKLSKEVVEKT